MAKGLVNGNMRIITEIIWPHFRRNQVYDTDILSARVDFGPDGIHAIKSMSKQFPAKHIYDTAERQSIVS